MGALETSQLLKRHLLTVDDFYRVADAGVFGAEARVELIEGEIIDMAPQKSRHAAVVNALMRRLVLAVGPQALVNCQTPLRLSERTEPEPDVMLVQAREDGYAAAHPGAADVFLVIEVADTSARYDREIKVPLYARHGVAEVWIFDLEASRLRLYRQPAGGEYAETKVLAEPLQPLPVPGLEGVALDVSGLLA